MVSLPLQRQAITFIWTTVFYWILESPSIQPECNPFLPIPECKKKKKKTSKRQKPIILRLVYVQQTSLLATFWCLSTSISILCSARLCTAFFSQLSAHIVSSSLSLAPMCVCSQFSISLIASYAFTTSTLHDQLKFYKCSQWQYYSCVFDGNHILFDCSFPTWNVPSFFYILLEIRISLTTHTLFANNRPNDWNDWRTKETEETKTERNNGDGKIQ